MKYILKKFGFFILRIIKKETSKTDKVMQYEPMLCAILLDWFDENYIENRKECAKAIIKGTIDYQFTPEQLKEGCEELKKIIIYKGSIWTHIKLIGDLCNIGISASIAGEKIREAILKMCK